MDDSRQNETEGGILRLYIVRHGQTDYNLNGFFQGTSDIPLNNNGLKQAGEIASKLGGVEFAAAWHSPLSRAKVTCETILAGRLSADADDRLKEVYFGKWEGVHRDKIKEQWPEQFEHYYSNIGDFHPPDGESLADAQERVGRFYDELRKNFHSGEILIVAHQFINALLCTYITGQDISEAWDFRAQPGEVFIIEIGDDAIVARKME